MTNGSLVLVEATVYDNITEANGRGEVVDALRSMASQIETQQTRIARLEAQLPTETQLIQFVGLASLYPAESFITLWRMAKS